MAVKVIRADPASAISAELALGPIGTGVTEGQLLALDSSGKFVLANAADVSKQAVAVASRSQAANARGTTMVGYAICVVTGLSVTANKAVFLDVADGMVTSTPPATTGKLVQAVGQASDTSTVYFSIRASASKYDSAAANLAVAS